MQRSSNQGCLPVFLRIFNFIAAAGFGLAALYLFFSSLQSAATVAQSNHSFVLAGLLLFLLIIQLFSVLRVMSSPPEAAPEQKKPSPTFLAASLCLIPWVGVVYLGEVVIRRGMSFVFMPLVVILAVALPVWWFIELGRRKLLQGSPLQTWGTVSIGTTLTPIVSMVFEILLIFLIAFMVVIILSVQPGFLDQITQFNQQLQTLPDLQQTQRLLEGALQSPVIVVLVLAFVSVVVPVTEEAIKPMGLFIFAGKRITPNQGFVLGMISGACFGFIESILMLNVSIQEGFYQIVLTRVATALLHAVTAGLTGWGYASAISQKKVKRMLLCFLAAICLHGVWNAFGVLVGVSPFFSQEFTLSFPAATILSQAAPFVLGLLTLGIIVILIVMNNHLQHTRTEEEDSLTVKPPPIPRNPPPIPGIDGYYL